MKIEKRTKNISRIRLSDGTTVALEFGINEISKGKEEEFLNHPFVKAMLNMSELKKVEELEESYREESIGEITYVEENKGNDTEDSIKNSENSEEEITVSIVKNKKKKKK